MLESFNTDNFTYQKLSLEEQNSRGILGRLVGIIADTKNPTRNGRKYSPQLWEKVFNDPIMQERIQNRCCFGELGHPADREETDMEKVAICLAEQPKKGKDGKLYGVFDILNTPNGKILKTLCDYGCNIGVSSRGSGDLVTDIDGNESVDEDTYDCQGWDAVIIPAVKEARLQYVTESLNKKKYNKTLRAKLQESLDKASADDKKIMEESLNSIGISLNEGSWSIPDNEKSLKELRKILENPISPDSAIDKLYNIFGDDDLYDNLSYDKEDGRTDCRDTIVYALKNLLDNESLDEKSSSILKSIIDEYVRKNPLHEDENSDRMEVNHELCKDDTQVTEDFRNDPLRQTIYDIAEYFAEAEYPIKSDAWFGYNNWNDVVDEINFNPEQTFEMAEGFKEELEDYIKTTDHLAKIAKKRGSDFDYYDDPEYEIFQDFLKDLNKYMQKYVDDHPMDESINEENGTAVENNEAMVEELQESLKQVKELQDKLVDLQEKLSVSYAKESKLEEEINKQKSAINNLTKTANMSTAFKQRMIKLQESNDNLKVKLKDSENTINKLNESIKTNKQNRQALQENLVNKEKSNKKLVEDLKQSKEEVKNLNEQLESLKKDYDLKKSSYAKKIEQSNQLVEKYKKVAARSVDKYIDLQARKLGVSSNEIKNKLPESYTFTDIDKACESVKQYKVNINRLPFNAMLNEEKLKIKATPSNNDKLAINTNVDDDVDDFLLNLANIK